MGKKVKMALYGEPGVGKSVFALGAPNPFFICTDGNYEWLEDFGADMNAHKKVSSWSEARAVFASKTLDDYDTIVVDLTEDLFKWCEQEYCVRNKIEHVSDHGYGKGYDTTRNEFFIELCKLISLNKHIILIMHGVTGSKKDRRGVEHTVHAPSNRIPDKVMNMIEGRMRYFLRCYLKAEETDEGVLIKRRYLSLIPKENEFGIARGLDESKVPHDIPLRFDDFARHICLRSGDKDTTVTEKTKSTESASKIKDNAVQAEDDAAVKTVEKAPAPVRMRRQKVEKVPEETAQISIETTTQAGTDADSALWDDTRAAIKEHFEGVIDRTLESAKKLEKPVAQEETKTEEQPVPEPANNEPKKELTNAERIAAIKAKLAASRAANK